MDAHLYDAQSKYFTRDTVELDFWGFHYVKAMFAAAAAAAAKSKTPDGALRQDKVLLFLHI